MTTAFFRTPGSRFERRARSLWLPKMKPTETGAATVEELEFSTAVSDGRHLATDLISKIESIDI